LQYIFFCGKFLQGQKEGEEMSGAGKKNKKKKKMSNDTIAILVILGIIFIAILAMVFFGSQSNISKLNGAGGVKASKKESSASLGVILVCSFITVFIITLFVIKKIRDGKRKAKLKAEQMEKTRRMEELKNAKERVRRAKMNEFLMAGESELEKRRKDAALLNSKRNQRDRSLRGPEQYKKRDLNEFRDELPSLNFYENENFIKRLVRRIKEFFLRKTDKD